MTSRLLPTYARVDLAFQHGQGSWLLPTDGESYLDFAGGVAVNGLGHDRPHLVVVANPIDRIDRAAGCIACAQRKKPPPYPPPHMGEGMEGEKATEVES